jgi:CheY-like chemotaxis protein
MTQSRVLVVDDDPKMLSLMHRGLAYAGYIVDLAKDGEAALTLARDHPPGNALSPHMIPTALLPSPRLRRQSASVWRGCTVWRCFHWLKQGRPRPSCPLEAYKAAHASLTFRGSWPILVLKSKHDAGVTANRCAPSRQPATGSMQGPMAWTSTETLQQVDLERPTTPTLRRAEPEAQTTPGGVQ